MIENANANAKNPGIKREWDNIRFLVTEAGTYRKKDDKGIEVGPEIPTEAGIKIITSYSYVSLTPLFVASLFQALNGIDDELRQEISRRLEVQKAQIQESLKVKL